MTDFTVSITDAASLAGITWAREQHNAQLPQDEAGAPIDPIADDAAYMQLVMTNATTSYGEQQFDAEWAEAQEAARVARTPPPPAGTPQSAPQTAQVRESAPEMPPVRRPTPPRPTLRR